MEVSEREVDEREREREDRGEACFDFFHSVNDILKLLNLQSIFS
jgi:hypothetical protein